MCGLRGAGSLPALLYALDSLPQAFRRLLAAVLIAGGDGSNHWIPRLLSLTGACAVLERVRNPGIRACLWLGSLIWSVTQPGCAFGPRALEKTHGRYQESILLVEEEQFVRNVVHLRYSEPQRNLSVSSIAAQYELAGSAEAKPFFIAPNPSNSNVIFRTFTSILPDLAVSGANRPTVTLIPSNDGENVRRTLTPITTGTLGLLTETSWPAAVIVRLWVERINGVPNAVTASGPTRGIVSDHARFLRAAELIQFSQDNQLAVLRSEQRDVVVGGPVPAEKVTPDVVLEAAKAGLEYRPGADDTTWVVVRKESRLALEVNPLAAGSPEFEELTELLNLEPGLPEYEVVVPPGVLFDPAVYPQPQSTKLRIMPRSTSQVLYFLSTGVNVPPEHLACGFAQPLVDQAGEPVDGLELTRGLFEVHVCRGHNPPPCAYVAVRYRDCWYYIDDRDQASKATLTLMLQLQRLDFGNDRPAAPFLTLPVGR
jgi:hypothetical protein